MVVQSLWVGDHLRTMERLCISSYLCNGHDFHLYAYNPVDGIPEGTTVKDANEVMPNITDQFTYMAQFADWWRYNLIYQKGGWWVDTDTVCLKPFDDLNYEHVLEGYVKAPAGSPVIGWLIDQCKLKDWKTMPYGGIGPFLYKEVHERFGFPFTPWPNVLHAFDDTAAPGVYITDTPPEIPADAHAAHLFNGMWRHNGVDVDAEYPRSCLYEQFKRRYL
jgi:hypothetical protein